MDAALLRDPAFWGSGGVFAPGGFDGRIAEAEGLEGQVLFATSGSSGEPKWVALSKEALLISAAAVNRHLEVDEASVWGLALPLHHVGGFGVAARAFEAGCAMSRFPERWNAEAFAGWLEKERVSHLSLVPTQVHDLVRAGLRAPETLQAVVVGGGSLDEGLGNAARGLGWPVLASYGMTEAGSQIATQEMDLLDVPYQRAPIRLLPIWRAETDEEGRLRILGPALFTGMVRRDGEGWRFERREPGWHVTADRARLEGDLLTPVGRADAMVKVLGELVDPEAIEKRLQEIGGGRLRAGAFAVVPVPDARTEHALVPVFEEPAERSSVMEVLEVYGRAAAGFERLREPLFLNDFPRSELGKLKRAELRSLVAGLR